MGRKGIGYMSSRLICNSSAFLSGCFPVALIDVLYVAMFRSTEQNWGAKAFAWVFLVVTIIASVCFYFILQNHFREATTSCKIGNLKRVNVFSSSAISYYTLPFISFVGDSVQSAVTLFILVAILLVIFNNNMMFMYTPLLDFLGYKVLEGEIIFMNGSVVRYANIVVKTDKGLYFSSHNDGLVEKVNEDTFFFIAHVA